jgi:D-glycero-D-manno-heptose 1,7-bisphosphate phosphatase
MTRAVFLDRDGVLVRAIVREGKPYPPRNLSEVEIVFDAVEALSQLKSAGYLLIVVTNQPDVARGAQDRAVVENINAYLGARVPIDDCLMCYHEDQDGCTCRKPLPGLILLAAEKHHVDPKSSFLIGDRWRDIDAGYAAGCRTILIDHGYLERAPVHAPNVTVTSLKDAAAWILSAESGAPRTQSL